MKAYKAFNKDMTCLGFQFKEGETYVHEGPVSLCESGFHACLRASDVWGYYPFASFVHEVEVEDFEGPREDCSKVAARRLTVGRRLSPVEIILLEANSATSGDEAHSATSGDRAHSATSGNWANSATSGDRANSATSGDEANSATSGYEANSATSGNWANSATSGNRANSATSGDRANSATSGNWANSATSGDRANSATNGAWSNSATSGAWSNSATSGDRANSSATGANSVAAAIGQDSRAMVGEGGLLILVEHDEEGRPVKAHQGIGGKDIKALVWYAVIGGQLVEVSE